MVSAVIGNWLAQAGLQQFTANFAGLPEDGFLKLIMQDFPRYGITSLEDKQKLYRLIKAVKAESEPKARPAPAPAQSQGMLPLHDANAGLLNLDDHDEDLLAHVS